MRKNKKRNHQKHPVPNHKYKDRLFRLVFNNRITNIRIGFFVWFSITRGIFWTCTMHWIIPAMKIRMILKWIHWRTLFISLWKMIFHSWSAGHWISMNIRARIIQICHCADWSISPGYMMDTLRRKISIYTAAL